MSAKAFPISKPGKRIGYGGGRGDLFEAATQTNARRRIPPLDDDTPALVSESDRRELVTLSRHLFANFPVVTGVVEEIGDFAGALSMRFKSGAEDWNETVQDWLEFNDEVVATTGAHMALIRYLAAIAIVVDGDIGFILTESENGLARIQPIPGHRIGSRSNQTEIKGGPFDGAKLIDGVVVNAIGSAIGYQVLGETAAADVVYSARNFHLCFLPFRTDQLRGVPMLASGIKDWQDVKLTKEYELSAQKLGAYQGLIEKNEAGEPEVDLAKQMTRGAEPTVSGGAETTTPEVYSYSMQGDGALVRWFKAGQGGLEAFRNDRPSGDARAFWAQVVRECLCGIGYSYDFAVDPGGVSGAAVRVVVGRINRFIAKLSRFAIKPLQTRIDGYRIAKAIKQKRLAFNVDWYRREYSGGAKLTADAKHQSDTAIQNTAAGFESVQGVTAELGKNWKEIIREKIEFRNFLENECAACDPPLNPETIVSTNPKNPQGDGEGISNDTTDSDSADSDDEGNDAAAAGQEFETLKAEFDAYGVAVRAGAITPQPDDEKQFRQRARLPGMSGAVSNDWKKDKGARRPITLTPRGAESVNPPKPASNEGEE